ncbi:class I SAM-dependent methyltransferase [Nonomuraea muscovyensis]|uniref:SAM-dependent methyltransferase n=1 Tax=Nonomuraea muscovyensis TaxID=1124761 RepID=A0A7X0C975_9ACTN|nr:class I SAM-dependent methyltransferase [Nonomuraea muscovyensis]MBB6349436.1 SAM-dependent methyltransferase [Nonomuraea muscovyensis]
MTAASTPDRLVRAVEAMAVGPADRVLEIGCGRGAAVALVCARLAGGTITAIDRSQTAIAAAKERNAAATAAGTAVLHATSLEDAAFEDGAFDKVFAVNVNLFWVRSPARELRLISRWLAPGGGLHLFWQAPGDAKAAEIAAKVPPALAEGGFHVESVTASPLVRVTARRS